MFGLWAPKVKICSDCPSGLQKTQICSDRAIRLLNLTVSCMESVFQCIINCMNNLSLKFQGNLVVFHPKLHESALDCNQNI